VIMKKILFFSIVAIVVSGVNFLLQAQQLAFPGAEGYGKYASGGRGGRVIEVTSLLDTDKYGNVLPGTLRAALATEGTDPITIVFKVSGIINLNAYQIKCSRPNITIAGQTAPGGGICIRKGYFKFSGDNLIIRYMRFRPGDELRSQVSGINIENAKNFIIDHCSMSWAIEENATFYDNKYTTVQWCIISESLYDSYHSKGARGYAGQWGGQYASYHHNLIAHNNSRSPRINGCRAHDTIALLDLRNNVIFNWGKAGSIYGGELEIYAEDPEIPDSNIARCNTNMVNNYYKPGPATPGNLYFAEPSYESNAGAAKGYGKWYFSGNYMEGIEGGMNDDNWLGVGVAVVGSADSIKSDIEFEVEPVTTHTAQEAYDTVLAYAGAILPRRDAVDMRIVSEVKGEIPVTGDGVKGENSGIIDTQASVGGWPEIMYFEAPADNDHDGMPDDYELANSLDPGDTEDGKTFADNGYTNLENYLNSIVPSEIVGLPYIVNNDFRIYPNPANNKVYFAGKENIKRAELFDLTGKLISVKEDFDQNSYFKIANLIPGIYFIKIIFHDGYFVNHKIIKH
jgi:pectate lyase